LPEALPTTAEADHLTEVLRRSGVLGSARVCDVAAINSFAKLRSLTWRLRLSYDGSAGQAPASLILKTGHVDRDGRPSYANRREIAFYREIAPSLDVGIVPRCYGAIEVTDISPWHLLLEDLTVSHFLATEHPLPPTAEQCEKIVEAWAKFHAAWWDDPRLGAAVGSWPAPAWGRYLRGFQEQLSRFNDRFGQVMPAERHEIYRRLIDQAPRLLARLDSRRNLTLVHGDAHWWNCFVPRDNGNVRLIDWEDWASTSQPPTWPI
jgi:hypothetical protein